MKTWVMIFLLAQITSSCIAPKNLTKDKAITREFLAGLEPGKKYLFELKIGTRQVVRINQINDNLFTGQIYVKDNDGKRDWSDFSETFENIEKNVAKISVYKVNPYLTTAGITVVVLVTAAIIWVNTAW